MRANDVRDARPSPPTKATGLVHFNDSDSPVLLPHVCMFLYMLLLPAAIRREATHASGNLTTNAHDDVDGFAKLTHTPSNPGLTGSMACTWQAPSSRYLPCSDSDHRSLRQPECFLAECSGTLVGLSSLKWMMRGGCRNTCNSYCTAASEAPEAVRGLAVPGVTSDPQRVRRKVPPDGNSYHGVSACLGELHQNR